MFYDLKRVAVSYIFLFNSFFSVEAEHHVKLVD